MIKPTPITKAAIDWNEAVKFIETQLGYDLRDASGKADHFVNWCRRHNKDNAGSNQEEQKQWSEYVTAPDGQQREPEYRDYWHFLIDHCDIHNGGSFIIYSWLLDDCEPWQEAITQAFLDHFGDECEFWTDW